MAASMPVCVFIPHTIINQMFHASYALGYWHASENNFLINCTIVVERKNQDLDSVLCRMFNYNLPVEGQKSIQLLGLFYSSEEEEHFETKYLKSCLHNVGFIIRINEVLRSFHVEHINVKYFSDINVRVIIYDGYSIANTQLLPLNKNIIGLDHSNKTFIAFLLETCQKFENNLNELNCHDQLNNLKVYHFIQSDNEKSLHVNEYFLFIVLWIISIIYRFASFVFKRWPQYMKNIMLLTALGQQFHQRYIHCSVLFADFKSKIPVNVKCKNLIFALLIDFIFGCLVSYALLNTNIPSLMLNTAISKTNDIVSGLQNLINWLMGVPAGLKLNIPLNNALGKFFLYHIYLWESYMMVVQPLFSFIFKMSTVIGVFGLTFVLSLLNDLISLATIHIYCFYGYAARLYGYQVMSLAALWRLFRGKKWNPLRKRIDSYTYSVHQLYLGTLIFTVLLFLLPTVMVYYFVFTCLRILVLVIQGAMSRIINTLTICPLYSIVSRIFNSSETTGDVYFTVLNADGVLTLSMQASQIPIKTVIQLTLPDLKKYYEVLTWKEFLSSIMWGKIVYPL